MAITESMKASLVSRLNGLASQRKNVRRIDVRFRGNSAYVDAYVIDTWYPEGATDEQKAAIDGTPVHLCRLDHIRGNRWRFAFYRASIDRYEPSILPSGSFEGTAEECFECAAFAYLRNVG